MLHLRDEALQRASDVAGDIFSQIAANGQDAAKKSKVVNLDSPYPGGYKK